MAGRIEAETLRESLDAQQPVTGLDIRSQTASLTATHTPSHTNESTSYVLNETAVFAGDTLLTNGVGRPDLQATPEAARRRACALFASLRRLRELRSEIIVLPVHTSEPIAFDERAEPHGWLTWAPGYPDGSRRSRRSWTVSRRTFRSRRRTSSASSN